ncbi:hypothetical protein LJR220_001549 [Bradyrhizobium sp. LjRoot220]|uniref:hypothetical protein n=1 Tax=Bradyrhizobium sp. LjRoot220 TaxID=3342284 RepID=UPI003ECDA51D
MAGFENQLASGSSTVDLDQRHNRNGCIRVYCEHVPDSQESFPRSCKALRTVRIAAIEDGEGDQMVLPEEMPASRSQIFDDKDRMKVAMESLEKENRSLKDLVIQLSTLVIRRVTGKK